MVPQARAVCLELGAVGFDYEVCMTYLHRMLYPPRDLWNWGRLGVDYEVCMT